MMVTITSVKARTVRIPLSTPVAFSTRSVAQRFYTLVRIECSDGSYGLGFCHCGNRFGDLATLAIRELFRSRLVGQDPHCTEAIWHDLYQDSLLNGRHGAVMRALSAVDIALWDRNARSAGLPLWRYIGSFQREDVPAYASGGYYVKGGPEEIADEIRSHVADGFTAVKMKIGAVSPEADRARVAAAREVLGQDGMLMLDANNAWSDVASALRAIEPLLDYHPYFIEEPFAPEDVDNHRRLADRISVPIATGEIVGGRWAHRDLVERGGVTVLQADAAVCGGITEWRRVAGMAAAQSVPMAPHSFHDLHVHLVAAVPNGLFVEYFKDDKVLPFRNILDRQLSVRSGRLVLPTDPGLGFEFDAGALEKFGANGWE